MAENNSRILKITVAGGAGFIGSNFVNQTLRARRNINITVLDSLTYAGRKSNLDLPDDRLRVVKGDIRDKSLLEELIPKTDLVVNFAAESHNDNSLKNPRQFLETNVVGTFELIQACSKHDVRYHHVSTDEVFGDLPLEGNNRFTPDTPYSPSSPYSATKAASDLLVRAWVRSFSLRATISNCSNNYGPNQHEEKFIPRTVLLAASGIKPKIYGDGANVRDWIHVNDHIDGIWAVIEKGCVGQTYLLGANAERTNLQVVQAILKELGLREDFIEFVPDRPGHDLKYAIDASKARDDLGWEPKYASFEEGLKPVVEHYVELALKGRIDISKISDSGPSTSF